MLESEEHTKSRALSTTIVSDPGVVAALESALNQSLTQLVDAGDQFCGLLVNTLSESLEDHGHADWAQGLRTRLEMLNVPADGAVSDIVKALGQAVGQFCGSNPVESRLRLARNVIGAVPECLQEIKSAAYSALRNTSDAPRTLLLALQQRTSNFASNSRDLADLYFHDIRALNTSRSVDLKLRYIWDASRNLPPFIVHDEWAFDLLRQSDLSVYLQLLGELPHHEFARRIIVNAGWTANLDDLTELLRRAPPAFNEKGALTSTAVLVLFVLESCIKRWFGPEHYHPNSPHNAAVKEAATFEAESARILQSLSERSDSMELRYAWLQHLIASSRARSARRVGPDDHSSVERWFALIGQLGRSMPIHPVPYEWIQGEDSLWRNERVYALLAVLVFKEPVDAKALTELLKTCLTKGLVGSHAIEQLDLQQQTCNFCIVASAITSLKEPAEWFKDVWAAIFSHRDRARSSHRNPNGDFQNVGQVAVFWALAGLAQLASDSPAARSLWVALEIAVRESSLTDLFRTVNDPWCVAARLLAAYWNVIFTDDPSRGTPGSLDDFLLNWAKPDADFADIASELASCGVTADQFKRSLGSGELLRAALEEVSHMQQSIRTPMPTFNVEGLAAAIDAAS
ncbi:MAG: hypothetical protein QOF32_2535 [Gammaproteobacteria bacterium]|jgi:hypothetical protein|nr:hypothetical protein [Gammaproteobacteria bacterium]